MGTITRMCRPMALAASLAVGVLLAVQETRPPDARPPTAPPDVFSAGRAMADIRQIARAPHPVGSAENARVRDTLTARMAALGLSPQVQRGWAAERFAGADDVTISAARVENVIGVFPGRDRTAPALALMAHYDSRTGSPGAADDAAGVAAILEIARILKAEGPPARDVFVLLTDGEEAGLLGARAFFDEHPLAGRIGLVLNLEARGSSGRAAMFETGPKNGPLIELYRRVTDDPFSNSLSVLVYRIMPNDTDLTVPLARGIAGLNYAFIATQFDYHSPSATPENLDQDSLQHLGDQVLAVARAVALSDELPGQVAEATYGELPGSFLLVYPAWGGWIVLAGAGLLLVLAARRAVRAGALRWPDVAKGAAATVYLVFAGALLLGLGRRATGLGFAPLDTRPILAQFTLWKLTLSATALAVLVSAPVLLSAERARLAGALPVLAAGALGCLFAGLDPLWLAGSAIAALIAVGCFGRAAHVAGAWAGVLALGFLVALALQIAAPTAAYLVTWPLLIASAGAAATALTTVRRPEVWVLLGAIGAAGIGWIGTYFLATADALGQVEVLAVFVWLAALVTWPLVQPSAFARASLAPGAVLLALAAAGVVTVRVAEPWSERYPRPVYPLHVVDADARRAWRVAAMPELDPWSDRLLRAGGGEIVRQAMGPPLSQEVHAAPTPYVAAPSPRIDVTTTGAGTADARVSIRAVPAPGIDMTVLTVDLRTTDATTAEPTLNGRPIGPLAAKDRWTRIRWHAGPEGFVLSFRPSGPGAVEVHHAQVSSGWPASQPLAALPPDTALWSMGGSTVVTGSTKRTW